MMANNDSAGKFRPEKTRMYKKQGRSMKQFFASSQQRKKKYSTDRTREIMQFFSMLPTSVAFEYGL